MVELPPSAIVGLFVELIAVPAAPEKPVVFAVWNVPLIVTTEVALNVFE